MDRSLATNGGLTDVPLVYIMSLRTCSFSKKMCILQGRLSQTCQELMLREAVVVLTVALFKFQRLGEFYSPSALQTFSSFGQNQNNQQLKRSNWIALVELQRMTQQHPFQNSVTVVSSFLSFISSNFFSSENHVYDTHSFSSARFPLRKAILTEVVR